MTKYYKTYHNNYAKFMKTRYNWFGQTLSKCRITKKVLDNLGYAIETGHMWEITQEEYEQALLKIL